MTLDKSGLASSHGLRLTSGRSGPAGDWAHALRRKNVERFVYELYSENTGACRFHRKWTEDLIDEIVVSHFDLPGLNYWDMNFKLAQAIHDHQSVRSVPWESERVVDIIFGFLENWERDGLKDPDLTHWLERFRSDKLRAARDFWNEMYVGMCAAFEEGLSEPAQKKT